MKLYGIVLLYNIYKAYNILYYYFLCFMFYVDLLNLWICYISLSIIKLVGYNMRPYITLSSI